MSGNDDCFVDYSSPTLAYHLVVTVKTRNVVLCRQFCLLLIVNSVYIEIYLF